MYKNNPTRGLAFSLALSIVLICIVTAAFCGVIILIKDLPSNNSVATSADSTTYYAVGKSYSSLSEVQGLVNSEKAQGRAGYIYTTEQSFFLIYALYSSESDASAVQSRLGAELISISVPAIQSNSENLLDAVSLLKELVSELEVLWRSLDESSTSESLAALTIENYSAALGKYSAVSELSSLMLTAQSQLNSCVQNSDYTLSTNIKYTSAAIACGLETVCRTLS